MTTNEGGRGVRRQFFPFGNRMGKRSTKGGARRASLVISSESGPNPARPSNSDRFPGIGEKVMQERSEMRFLHHFLRGRRGDWDEMPEGERRYVMLGSRKPELVHQFFT